MLRHCRLQVRQLLLGQRLADLEGRHILLQVLDALGARNRKDVFTLRRMLHRVTARRSMGDTDLRWATLLMHCGRYDSINSVGLPTSRKDIMGPGNLLQRQLQRLSLQTKRTSVAAEHAPARGPMRAPAGRAGTPFSRPAPLSSPQWPGSAGVSRLTRSWPERWR